ncbi:MAG: hypothetical protein GF368_03370 [Candidatus Aenigmarchaeota archaeon]|nr:hypothetical protein [Candidatus Aenigmarchaeota archaeon]
MKIKKKICFFLIPVILFMSVALAALVKPTPPPPAKGGLVEVFKAAGIPSWPDTVKTCLGLIPGNCGDMLLNTLIGLPDWVFTSGSIWYLIQYLVIPFLGTWMIMYGFMKELRIFRRARKVNTWLAFLAAFSLYPLHIAYPLTLLMFQIIGAWSVIVFGIIFVIGAWKYGLLRRAQWTSAAAVARTEADTREAIRKQRKSLFNERQILVEEIAYAEGKRLDQLTKRIEQVDNELARIKQQEAAVEEVTE